MQNKKVNNIGRQEISPTPETDEEKKVTVAPRKAIQNKKIHNKTPKQINRNDEEKARINLESLISRRKVTEETIKTQTELITAVNK